ncbi:MAG: DUF1080 domain-containing protein [Fidelibacterota bacterium]|nr:MAG: DUF1080 domain-containing protein [Candidatus Neomarinimicrobiota bacterium]
MPNSILVKLAIAARRRLISVSVTFLLMLTVLSCASTEKAGAFEETTQPPAPAVAPANTLTEAERVAGLQLLFDGKTFTGWRGLGRDVVPPGHWLIEDGCIMKVASEEVPKQADGQPLNGGDLMTIDSFENFELSFEWRISPGGNSGVKYNVSEELSISEGSSHSALGFEYQVLDDSQHPDAMDKDHESGGLYDLIAPQNKQLQPVGEFNQARIVFQGNHGEHWLNGTKVVDFDLGTPLMDSLLAASKYRNIPGFADKRKGHIILQDHGDAVWYRNIKIRVLQSR